MHSQIRELAKHSTEMKKLHADVRRSLDKAKSIDILLDDYKRILDLLNGVNEVNEVNEAKQYVQDKIAQYNNERKTTILELKQYSDALDESIAANKVLFEKSKKTEESAAEILGKLSGLSKNVLSAFESFKSNADREDRMQKVLEQRITELKQKYPADSLKDGLLAKIEKSPPKTLDMMYETLANAETDTEFEHIPLTERNMAYDLAFKHAKPDIEAEHYMNVLREIHPDLVFDIVVWSIINEDLPEDFLDQF